MFHLTKNHKWSVATKDQLTYPRQISDGLPIDDMRLKISFKRWWIWPVFFRMGKKPLVDSKIWGAGCHMWAWQTLWTMRPRGLKVDSVGVVGLKFFTGKDETKALWQVNKGREWKPCRRSWLGFKAGKFPWCETTNLISFVGYRSVSSNVWASHEQRPQPHRRSLGKREWKYSALMRRWVTQLTWSFFSIPSVWGSLPSPTVCHFGWVHLCSSRLRNWGHDEWLRQAHDEWPWKFAPWIQENSS